MLEQKKLSSRWRKNIFLLCYKWPLAFYRPSWQTFREYNLYKNPFFFEINLQIIQMPHCTRPLAIFIRFPPELLLHVYFLLSLVYPFLEQYPLSRFNIFKYRVSAPVNNRLRDIEPESNNDFHGCVDQI